MSRFQVILVMFDAFKNVFMVVLVKKKFMNKFLPSEVRTLLH
jgi:hypothetical protein